MKTTNMKTMRVVVPTGLILTVLLVGMITMPLRGQAPDAVAMSHAKSLSRAFRYAAEVATPSVVKIKAEHKGRVVNPLKYFYAVFRRNPDPPKVDPSDSDAEG